MRAIGVRAKARMPEGHPHASWAHVGALWPVVPASDDAIRSHARVHLKLIVMSQSLKVTLQSLPCCQ